MGATLAGQVENAGVVTTKEDSACFEVLHIKPIGVKFNGTFIIFCKLTDENEVFNNVWGDKNIFRVKRAVEIR